MSIYLHDMNSTINGLILDKSTRQQPIIINLKLCCLCLSSRFYVRNPRFHLILLNQRFHFPPKK